MTWRAVDPSPSVFDRIAGRRAENAFAAQVDRAFRADSAALARVRALVVAPGSTLAERPAIPRRRAVTLPLRGLPVAMALTFVVAVGLVAGGFRSGPLDAHGPAIDRPAQATTALDRSAAHLTQAVSTIRSGDAAAIASALSAYLADLAMVEADLRRPGVDLIAAANRLQSQARDLSTMAGYMPADDAALFRQVTGELDRIIASLPDTGPGGTADPAATPAPTDSHGPGAHPSPGANGNGHPGGNSDPNGNAVGNPHANPDPSTNPNPAGKSNGNAGGNGNGKGDPTDPSRPRKAGGNGDGHPKGR